MRRNEIDRVWGLTQWNITIILNFLSFSAEPNRGVRVATPAPHPHPDTWMLRSPVHRAGTPGTARARPPRPLLGGHQGGDFL